MTLRFHLVAVLVAAVVLCVGPRLAAAQGRGSDFELWTDLGLRLELPAHVDLTFTQFLRLDEGGSRATEVAPELAVRYAPWGWWRFESGYRYQHERDNDDVFQPRHRIFANTQLRLKLDPFRTSLRVQWQEQLRRDDDDGSPTRHHLRYRSKVEYQLDALTPFFTAEAFQRVDARDADVRPGTLQKVRFTLGVERDIGNHELSGGYRLVVPLSDSDDPILHILAVGFRFNVEAPSAEKAE